MVKETRVERWRRTGLLQIICAAIVFAVWVYFQATYSAAERPVILNEILLLAVGWLGGTFLFGKDGKEKIYDAESEPEEHSTEASTPETPEPRGRHAKEPD